MVDRQKRLNEAYEYLHENCNIHNKKHFADAIEYAYPYVSSALNGNEKYLTDKFFKSICAKFSEISLAYLLTGEGELLLQQQLPTPSQPESDILELYARMIRKLDDTRVELQKEIAEVRQLKDELRQAINHLNDTTYQIPDEAPRLAAEEIKTKEP
jgi:transcriptional regulatory protein LevR